MANWAELPIDLLSLIAKRVNLIEDFVAFGAVCTSWQSAASKDKFDMLSPQVPLLLLGAKEDDLRECYSLTRNKATHLFLPEARGQFCCSSEGWLCTISLTAMNLLNPFTRTQIQLPPLRDLLSHYGMQENPERKPWNYIDLAVLTANPSCTPDYALVLTFFARDNNLALWRPGDLNWIHIDIDKIGAVGAMIHYKGHLYCLMYSGELWVFDIPDASVTPPVIKPRLIADDLQHEVFINPRGMYEFYLVEVSGALFAVFRSLGGEKESEGRYETFKFSVCEIDPIKGKVVKEIKSLGDFTIFLGRNVSCCLDSTKFAGRIKCNHIYFTDDTLGLNRHLDGGPGRDMGTYNMENGEIEQFYGGLSTSLICPPTWINPTLW